MEAPLFAVITSLLAFGTTALAQEPQLADASVDMQYRCEKISDYMELETKKLELYRKLDENFAAYTELEAELPPDYLQVMGAHRFFALMRTEYLPHDLRGRVQAWQVSVDKSMRRLEKELGRETMDLIWQAYQLRNERTDLVEALAKLRHEQVNLGLASIRNAESEMESKGADFFAFDPSQPQPCW